MAIPVTLTSTRTAILVFRESYQDTRESARRVDYAILNSKPSPSTVSSTGASRRFTARGPNAPTTAETHQFSALEDKDPAPSNDQLGTSGASSHPSEKSETPSLPNPGEVAGETMPGDGEIFESIAKAQLDALQVKRSWSNLPVTSIPLACIRDTKLKQCLLAGRESSDSTGHATLDLISLE